MLIVSFNTIFSISSMASNRFKCKTRVACDQTFNSTGRDLLLILVRFGNVK